MWGVLEKRAKPTIKVKNVFNHSSLQLSFTDKKRLKNNIFGCKEK